MNLSWRIRLSALIVLVACLGFTVWWCHAAPNTGGKAGLFALALNTVGTEFDAGEAVPVIVALGNAGGEVGYVDKDPWRFEVTDVHGHRVLPRGQIEEPGPPPSSYYMMRAGERVYVVPVQELKGGEGIVAFPPKAMQWYNLDAGTYVIVAIADVYTCDATSIITREEEGLSHKTWVEPQPATPRVRVKSNPITIEMR